MTHATVTFSITLRMALTVYSQTELLGCKDKKRVALSCYKRNNSSGRNATWRETGSRPARFPATPFKYRGATGHRQQMPAVPPSKPRRRCLQSRRHTCPKYIRKLRIYKRKLRTYIRNLRMYIRKFRTDFTYRPKRVYIPPCRGLHTTPRRLHTTLQDTPCGCTRS